MATHPYKGSSSDQVLNLANGQNSKTYQLGVDFNWGDVEPAQASGGRNSRIRLISLKADYADDWLYYRRRPPASIAKQPEGDIQEIEMPALPTTTHAILDLINEALGLDLAADEVENLTYSEVASEYPLMLKATSLAWTSGTYMFKVVSQFPEGLRLVGDGDYRVIDVAGTFRVRE